MKKIFLFIVFLTLILRGVTTAQNPYESLGVPMPKGKMLTLSNGKFQEFFPNDTLTPIGSVRFNTVTGEIEAFLTRDTMYAEYNLEPEVVSRWLSPDPLGAKFPQWSPYNYVLNNPVIFIDPDGQFPYPIHIRSFAPFATFGGGYDGDNRGYSTVLGKGEIGELGVTSRIQQSFVVDTDKKDYSKFQVWSDPSIHPLLGEATEVPRGNVSNFEVSKNSEGNDIISFSATMAGKNPLAPGTPDIDVTTNFAITENKKEGLLHVAANMYGDKFPAAETLIGDTKGQQLLIGVSAADGNPYTSLPGDNKRPMMSSSMTIRINDKGVFINVSHGGKTYTLDAWNNHMKSQPTEVKK